MRGIFMIILLATIGCSPSDINKNQETDQLHIVFVIGDEEYRSEESMPMLAKIVKRELGAKVTLCYSLDSMGFIDPNRLNHIEGLEALETADLMVMFTRFRALPSNELSYITSYAESGRPMVGFRTSTHAFLYEDDSAMHHMNDSWPTKVFGQQWITHHGHFDDGANPLTAVSLMDRKQHPILRGLEAFEAYSWLYHVDGGEWNLHGDSNPLLFGRSLKSGHEMKGNLDKYPLLNPVAWTKTYTGKSNKTAKVFFTTLGHPFDWKNENMRRLAMNGIYWVLDLKVPEKANVGFVDKYEPNNSGFGKKYKQGMRPEVMDD
ncbi:MAG: ThuA domain-containing protein [Cyclobacteriaceae bacterium]